MTIADAVMNVLCTSKRMLINKEHNQTNSNTHQLTHRRVARILH